MLRAHNSHILRSPPLGCLGPIIGRFTSFTPSPFISSRSFHPSPTPHDQRAVLGQKILNKVPRFLKPYTINFINQPLKNLTSFLILHELTAIGPLIGLWYLFHKYNILIPLDLPTWAIEKGTKIIDDSLKSFDFNNYSLHDKFQLISEGAYAFVVVKMLMPVRLLVSFGLTPLFTKYVVSPLTGLFTKKSLTAGLALSGLSGLVLSELLPLVNNDGGNPGEVRTKKVDKRRL